MSILVPYNGSTFIIPTPNEVGWGTNLDNYLVAISNGSLQNIGGSFTLSNDVDFGGTNGLKSLYYKTRSANIAASGQFRLANVVDSISWRDFSNTIDLPLTVNSSNQLTFNGAPLATGGGSSITALTGDVTATGPGSSVATLATVNSNVGSFTNANITVDSKGRITAASNGSSGANTNLSNLSSTAINAALIPDTNNAYTLGSSSFIWNTIYATIFSVPASGSGGKYQFATSSWLTGTDSNVNIVTSGATIAVVTASDLTLNNNAGITLNPSSGTNARLRFFDNNTSLLLSPIDNDFHINLYNGSTGIEWLTVTHLDSTAHFNTGIVVQNSASDPTSPYTGQIYFNTGTNHFFGWDGSSWKQLDN